jgi:hypothetical protein
MSLLEFDEDEDVAHAQVAGAASAGSEDAKQSEGGGGSDAPPELVGQPRNTQPKTRTEKVLLCIIDSEPAYTKGKSKYCLSCKSDVDALQVQEKALKKSDPSRWEMFEQTKKDGGRQWVDLVREFQSKCSSKGRGVPRGYFDTMKFMEIYKTATKVQKGERLVFMRHSRWMTYAENFLRHTVAEAQAKWTMREKEATEEEKHLTATGEIAELAMPAEEYIDKSQYVEHAKQMELQERLKKNFSVDDFEKNREKLSANHSDTNDALFQSVGGGATAASSSAFGSGGGSSTAVEGSIKAAVKSPAGKYDVERARNKLVETRNKESIALKQQAANVNKTIEEARSEAEVAKSDKIFPEGVMTLHNVLDTFQFRTKLMMLVTCDSLVGDALEKYQAAPEMVGHVLMKAALTLLGGIKQAVSDNNLDSDKTVALIGSFKAVHDAMTTLPKSSADTLGGEWQDVVLHSCLDKDITKFNSPPTWPTVLNVVESFTSYCISVLELFTFIAGIQASGRPMPLSDMQNLGHVSQIYKTINNFNLRVTEDDVKEHDQTCKLMFQCARQIILGASGAAADVKAVVSRRRLTLVKEEATEKKGLSNEESKARKKEEKNRKQAEREIQKHDLHPVLAYKGSDGMGEMTTFLNLDVFQKSSHGTHVPYMISAASKALAEIVDDVNFKKVAAIFKSQFPATASATLSGRAQCPLRFEKVSVIQEGLMAMMPSAVKPVSQLPRVDGSLATLLSTVVLSGMTERAPTFIGFEHRCMPTIRLHLRGEREFVCVPVQALMNLRHKIDKKVGKDYSIVQLLTDVCKGLQLEELAAFSEAGYSLYRAVAGPNTVVFVPAGFMIVERVIGSLPSIALKLNVLASPPAGFADFVSEYAATADEQLKTGPLVQSLQLLVSLGSEQSVVAGVATVAAAVGASTGSQEAPAASAPPDSADSAASQAAPAASDTPASAASQAAPAASAKHATDAVKRKGNDQLEPSSKAGKNAKK